MSRPKVPFHEWVRQNDRAKIDFSIQYLTKKGVPLERYGLQNDSYRALVEWAIWAQDSENSREDLKGEKLIGKLKRCWNTRQSRKKDYGMTVYRLKMKRGIGEVLQKLMRVTKLSEAESLEMLLTNFEEVRRQIQINEEKKVKDELTSLRASQKQRKKKPGEESVEEVIDPEEKELVRVKRQLVILRDIADARLWGLIRYQVQFGSIAQGAILTEDQEIAIQRIYSDIKGVADKRMAKQARKEVASKESIETPALDFLEIPKVGARYQAIEPDIVKVESGDDQTLIGEPAHKEVDHSVGAGAEPVVQDNCSMVGRPVESGGGGAAKSGYQWLPIKGPIQLSEKIQCMSVRDVQLALNEIIWPTSKDRSFCMDELDQLCWRFAELEDGAVDKDYVANDKKERTHSAWRCQNL